MSYLFLGYSKCSTSNKAKKWLDDNKIKYMERSIVEKNPTYDEIKKWLNDSKFPIKRFFNTSGMMYKALGLKNKLSSMSEDDQIKLLSTNGKLIKRPILIGKNIILIGFKESEWETIL